MKNCPVNLDCETTFLTLVPGGEPLALTKLILISTSNFLKNVMCKVNVRSNIKGKVFRLFQIIHQGLRVRTVNNSQQWTQNLHECSQIKGKEPLYIPCLGIVSTDQSQAEITKGHVLGWYEYFVTCFWGSFGCRNKW